MKELDDDQIMAAQWLRLVSKFVYESNMIEDITTSFQEIQKEVCKMYFGTSGHVGAIFNTTISAWNRFLVTEQMLCEWHKLIIDEQNERFRNQIGKIAKNQIGQYRVYSVRVGYKICPGPFLIPSKMKDLIQKINEFQETTKQKPEAQTDKIELLKQISDFHFEFEEIHPFIDGNGRTGRLLVWFLCNYFSIFPPPIFTHKDKHKTYYPAFESKEKMRKYFMQKSSA
ncbi:MAG: Fic family protein [Patescibacteria group bacterium]